MKIEIFDAKSEECLSRVAPVQREMIAERGGLVFSLAAPKDEEAEILGLFEFPGFVISKKLTRDERCPMGVECRFVHESCTGNRTLLLVYQIYSEDGSISKCFQTVGLLFERIGELFKLDTREKRVEKIKQLVSGV